jgi:GTP-binding protein
LERHDTPWEVRKLDKGFRVSGTKIERFAARTDFDNPHGVRRLRDIMRKTGILIELEKRGIEPGDAIEIGREGTYRIEY